MIEKKTTEQIFFRYDCSTYDINKKCLVRDDAIADKEWVSVESLTKYLNSELNDLHKKLLDKELPELCQANCSGAIIWLKSLKSKLKVVE